MNGFFVKHTYCGLGKITEATSGQFVVFFFEGADSATFDRDAFSEHELVRTTLPIGSRCVADGKKCSIDRVECSSDFHAPNFYEVTFDSGGLRAKLSEVELSPANSECVDDPLSALSGLKQRGYSLFQVRERLVSALHRQLRHGSGLRALLSSRIDLRPHQAYVAGLVLLDAKRRFLLADEVGLGKTIEAGIVIHDLLINKPTAKVLVVCPGALTQQWLCELYSKFGGHVFKLLELHSSDALDWPKVTRLIAPFSQAAYEHAERLLQIQWDMVVIDEAHHLLASESLYEFALRLSNNAPSLLLLSAIPAQRREDEFLRLLGLLDPQQYTPEVVSQRERFRELFESQRAIGRKLRLLRRRLDGIATHDFTKEEAIEQAMGLLTLPVLRDDATLVKKVEGLASLTDSFQEEVGEILRYIGDTYRINRRILRNRRERLVEEEQIVPIERKLALFPYEAEQLELEVNESIHRLIVSAKEKGLRDELLTTLSRVLWQSMVHPQAICNVLGSLATAEPRKLKEDGVDFLALGYLCGYSEWDAYLALLGDAVRECVDDDLMQEAMTRAKRWSRDVKNFTRYNELVKLLRNKISPRSGLPKILVFAGFPNVAAEVANRLRQDFGVEAVTEFRSELDREEKEANVRRFRSNPATWLMVLDESGGEGRNFQFADGLIHFDTPWYVSRVEQRIGRLDRLGRETKSREVLSEVVFDGTSVEAGLVRCYDAGVGVYRRSISGLEFALRDVEDLIVQTAIGNGREGLGRIVGELTMIAEEERARDDSEALLDEASFDRIAAEKFRRIRHSEENERDLEEAFTEFLRMVASNRSVRRISDSEFADGLWMLRTDEIHQIRSEAIKGLVDQTTPFTGTFRRAIAQQRLDLHFFSFGHPLFEAICDALFHDAVGRSYAVEIKDLALNPWVGFECVYYPMPDLSELADNLGLQNQARQVFLFRPVHVFCRHDGHIEADADVLLHARQSLEGGDKNRKWWNLTKSKSLALQDILAPRRWSDVVCQLAEVAAEKATCRFHNDVNSVVSAANKGIEEQIRRLQNVNGETTQVEQLRCLQRSLRNWRVQLDSVGFLSINGRILERRAHAGN